jgi:hypothetical protein
MTQLTLIVGTQVSIHAVNATLVCVDSASPSWCVTHPALLMTRYTRLLAIIQALPEGSTPVTDPHTWTLRLGVSVTDVITEEPYLDGILWLTLLYLAILCIY